MLLIVNVFCVFCERSVSGHRQMSHADKNDSDSVALLRCVAVRVQNGRREQPFEVVSRTGIEPTDPRTRTLPLFEIASRESRSVLRDGSPRPTEWWAHIELTRINTTPTILRKKVEDLRETRAHPPGSRRRSASSSHCAIFSSFAATRAQPSAVASHR